MTQNSSVLDQLYSVIQNRKSDNPATSYTAELLSQGMPKIAQKVGEEAVEVITAALVENENKVIRTVNPKYFINLLTFKMTFQKFGAKITKLLQVAILFLNISKAI